MNEFLGLTALVPFVLVLAVSYFSLNPEKQLAVRVSAIRQAEGVHNVRVNAFIFMIAALVRGLHAVALASGVAFIATFLFCPRASKVQGGTFNTELGFYLAFVLVLPPRLAALAFSSGSLSQTLALLAAACVASAAVVLVAPGQSEVLGKMRSVLAPLHNVVCICFLVVVTPIVGSSPFAVPHAVAAALLMMVAWFRARGSTLRQSQLAFFMHWPLPLTGGRLPLALVLLGGAFTAKAAVILATSCLIWGWVLGFHAPALEARSRFRNHVDDLFRRR
jgi:hypothetical protein